MAMPWYQISSCGVSLCSTYQKRVRQRGHCAQRTIDTGDSS
jgi:hypothetical protein